MDKNELRGSNLIIYCTKKSKTECKTTSYQNTNILTT